MDIKVSSKHQASAPSTGLLDGLVSWSCAQGFLFIGIVL